MNPSFRSLVVAASLLIASLSQAQGVLWQKTWGIQENQYDWGRLAQPCPDGSFMLAGYSDSELLVVKTDAKGHQSWRTTFSFAGYESLSVYSLKVDGEGNAYVIGSTYKSSPYRTLSFMLKLRSSDGAEVWRKVYDDPIVETRLSQVVITQDGNLLVNASQTVNYQTTGVLLTMSPATGEVLGTTPLSIALSKISLLQDGNLVGQTGAHAVSCVRSSDGSFLWTQDFPPPDEFDTVSIFAITVSPSGSIYVLDTLNSRTELRRLNPLNGRVTWLYQVDVNSSRPVMTLDTNENPVVAAIFTIGEAHGARVVKVGKDGGKAKWHTDITSPPAMGLLPTTITVTPKGVVFLTTFSTNGTMPPYRAMGIYGLYSSTGALRFGRVETGAGTRDEEVLGALARVDGSLLLAGNIGWQNSDSFGTWTYNGLNGRRTSQNSLIARGPSQHWVADAHTAYGLATVGSTRYSWLFQHQSWDGMKKWQTVVRKGPRGSTYFPAARLTGSVAYADPKTGYVQVFALGSLDTDCDVVAVGGNDGKVAWRMALVPDLLVNASAIALGGPQSDVCVLGTNQTDNSARILRMDRQWGWPPYVLDLPINDIYAAKLATATDGNLILRSSTNLYKVSWADGSVLWSKAITQPNGYSESGIPLDGDGVYTTTSDATGVYVEKISQSDGSTLWSKKFELTDLSNGAFNICTTVGYVAFLASDANKDPVAIRLSATDGTEAGRVPIADPSGYFASFAITSDGLGYLTGTMTQYDENFHELGSLGVTHCLDFGDGSVRWTRFLQGIDGSHSQGRRANVNPYGDVVVSGSIGTTTDPYAYDSVLTSVCYSRN